MPLPLEKFWPSHTGWAQTIQQTDSMGHWKSKIPRVQYLLQIYTYSCIIYAVSAGLWLYWDIGQLGYCVSSVYCKIYYKCVQFQQRYVSASPRGFCLALSRTRWFLSPPAPSETSRTTAPGPSSPASATRTSATTMTARPSARDRNHPGTNRKVEIFSL